MLPPSPKKRVSGSAVSLYPAASSTSWYTPFLSSGPPNSSRSLSHTASQCQHRKYLPLSSSNPNKGIVRLSGRSGRLSFRYSVRFASLRLNRYLFSIPGDISRVDADFTYASLSTPFASSDSKNYNASGSLMSAFFCVSFVSTLLSPPTPLPLAESPLSLGFFVVSFLPCNI